MTKKGLLNRASAITLGLAFAAATIFVVNMSAQEIPHDGQTASADAHPGREPDHTYWSMKDYGVVLDVWNCPETGICARVASVDPNNKKMREFVAKHVLKIKPEQVRPEDIERFCGFQPQLTMTRAPGENGPLGKWEGSVTIDWTKLRDRGDKDSSNYGLNIEQTKDKAGKTVLRMHGYWRSVMNKFLFGAVSGDVDLTPAEKPAQSCAAPAPGV